MRSRAWLCLFLTLWALQLASLAEPAPIEETGQLNLFLDEKSAQVHVLLRPKQRLLLAFPAENSGHGIWFEGEVRIRAGSLRALPAPEGSQRVELQLEVRQPTVLRKVLLDSLRVLRDQGEGDGRLADQVEAARQKLHGDSSRMGLSDHLGGVRYQRRQMGVSGEFPFFELHLAPAIRETDDEVRLWPGDVTLTATLPFAPMPGFHPDQLYGPEYRASASANSERVSKSMQALEFLTRREKMMAGSWRFLTYFGRDTLISTAMLAPILSEQALRASVQSVLERLSADGAVAHEEDIGPFAEWHHLQNGEVSLKPVYDTKMIDDDLLLPLLLVRLVELGHQELLTSLLSDPALREKIVRNADYVRTKLAQPDLIRLLPGEKTGDWRDSHEGLGDGVYPASVNSDLAPITVRALAQLESLLPSPRRAVLSELKKLEGLWDDRSQTFWVELSAEQVKARLEAYASTLDEPRRAGFDKLRAEHEQLLEQPLRFPVLSLDDRKRPVEVIHSDVAFTLFYGQPKQDRLSDILTLLERPFPYGLKTPAGYLVSNPIFSSNVDHYRSLGFGQYHGLVVWSWPQAMLSLGLLRQHGRFAELDERIARLAREIRNSEERVGALATSELWAVDLDQTGLVWRGYGEEGDQTESNALQLWSTVYPALEYARSRSTLFDLP